MTTDIVSAETEKKCGKCGLVKSRTEFNKRAASKDGLNFKCRECAISETKAWRMANPEKVKESGRIWYSVNSDKAKASKKVWVLANSEKVRAGQKAWALANPEKKKEGNRAWALANAERDKANQKAWRTANPEYQKTRYMTDANYRLRNVLRSRIRIALKSQSASKTSSSAYLLGCPPAEAMAHLEKQFKPGWTWENHGVKGWHIDHIRPLASFDLRDPEQQKVAFHYTNLQPLWWTDNLSKGDKY